MLRKAFIFIKNLSCLHSTFVFILSFSGDSASTGDTTDPWIFTIKAKPGSKPPQYHNTNNTNTTPTTAAASAAAVTATATNSNQDGGHIAVPRAPESKSLHKILLPILGQVSSK